MNYIEMENLQKSYDGQTNVLHNINLSIEEDEFFVIVGPSGSGKSTLLRMIAGLENITDGTLKIDDRYANHLSAKDRGVSMVFQNDALYPHMTVENNILFSLKANKIAKETQQQRLMEAAEMMDMRDVLQRKPSELSGGQKQRVALAKAIVSRAPICLMDEPLSSLDAQLRSYMRIELGRLQRRLGIAMVYVTHDQLEAMTMGDRIMVLDNGEIQQVGNPITIYNEPANLFVASFIGSPKMNLGKAVFSADKRELCIEDDVLIAVDASELEEIPKDQPLWVGIRAEHIQPSEQQSSNHYAQIINVEQLGNETSAVFSVGSRLWKLKWPGQREIHVGDSIPVHISTAYLCFFDEAGQLIRPAAVNTTKHTF